MDFCQELIRLEIMKKYGCILLLLLTYCCREDNRNEDINASEEVTTANYEYVDIEFNNIPNIDNFKIEKRYKELLEAKEVVNFKKIEEGDEIEYNKLKNFNSDNINFQKLFYGECWDSRPKDFRELDYIITIRKSLFRLDETNLKLLKLFNIIGVNVNRKNRLYMTEVSFTGRHFCNNRIYKYYNKINILYKVKLKRGGILISNLKELGANVSANLAEVEYIFIAEGIQINPDSKEVPKYPITAVGTFNDKTKSELDKKIDYFLSEISKENGVYIGRPFPLDFEIYYKD